MGCWNVSCAITKLPILLDEEVVQLTKHDDLRGPILKTTSMYYGKYNEYGDVIEKKEVFDVENLNSSDVRFFYIKRSVWDVIIKMDIQEDYMFKCEKEHLTRVLDIQKNWKELQSNVLKVISKKEPTETQITDVLLDEKLLDALLKIYVFSNRYCFKNGGQHEEKNVEYYKKFIKIYTKEVSKL